MASNSSTSRFSGSRSRSKVRDEAKHANSEHSNASSARPSWFEAWRARLGHWLSGRSSTSPAVLDAIAREVHLRLARYSDKTLAERPQSYLFHLATNVLDEGQADNPEDSYTESGVSNEQVRMAVSRLPRLQREVLLLHITEGLTSHEIAAKLNLTPQAVQRDVARAYAQLRCDLTGLDQN